MNFKEKKLKKGIASKNNYNLFQIQIISFF